jgi:hypothetical protein
VHWDGTFFGRADLTITACGTDDTGPYALAPGPDLDGDGLPELAVGAPGADLDAAQHGVVYLLRGADLAAGASVFSAWAFVPGPMGVYSEGFGKAVAWVGDRDGDGVEDLLVTAESGAFRSDVGWVVSGADLLAGGEVAVASAEMDEEEARYARWDDLDGDGLEDWILGMPNRGMGGYGTRGALGVVLDGDFDLSGTPTRTREVWGEGASAGAGATIAVLDGDYDNDGIRELATALDGDTVVVNSGALLTWATYVDELVRWRFTGMDASDYTVLLALGDIDGGGRDDLLFLDPGHELCVGRGEDADETAGTTTCFDSSTMDVPLAVSRGSDLDGDGIAELWGRTTDALIALDVPSLFTGAVTEHATIAVADGYTDVAVTVAEGQVWTSARVTAREEADAVWAFAEADGLTTAEAEVVVTGGGWGGDAATPTWVDASGDGLDDLLILDDNRLWAFDGANLPTGGARTVCDAEWSPELDGAYDFDWVGDVDGDGVQDAVVVREGETDVQHTVTSGRVVLGLDPPASIAEWESDRMIPWPHCDLTGDGRDDLVASEARDVSAWYDASLLTTGDTATALLGRIDKEDSYQWCIPDLDGDGRDELVVLDGSDRMVLRSAQLDPATTLTPADAWAHLMDDGRPGWTSPLWFDDLDGDGAEDPAWTIRQDVSGTVYSACVFDPTPLAAGGTLDITAATLRCVGDWEDIDATGLFELTGDGVPDLLMYASESPSYDWSFYAIDGTDGATLTALEPMSSVIPTEDQMVSTEGFGGDVGGLDAPALWITWYHLDQRLTVLEVLYPER